MKKKKKYWKKSVKTRLTRYKSHLQLHYIQLASNKLSMDEIDSSLA